MPATRSALPAVILLALCLQACSSTQTQPPPTAPEPQPVPEEVPELTLNLPHQDNCSCVTAVKNPSHDYTFLEKGFSALVAGDYIEAVQYFERYKRLEDTPASEWEAGVAVAYISMLAESPFHDPEAARKSYRSLRKKYGEELKVHEVTLMMRNSLETFIGMDRRIDELKSENSKLREELAKRDEAIRRLRELTLGQKGAAQ